MNESFRTTVGKPSMFASIQPRRSAARFAEPEVAPALSAQPVCVCVCGVRFQNVGSVALV